MKCQNCGNEVKEDAKFCRECGSEIIQRTEALASNSCSECGNILEENAVFCNNCGQRVIRDEDLNTPSRRCTNCNAILREGALFCGECGTSLSSESIPQKASTEPSPKNKDKSLVFLVVLLIVVLIGSVGVIGYVYYQNNSVNVETPDISVDKKLENKENDTVFDDKDEVETTEIDPISGEDYLFPSDQRYITNADLSGKTKEEVAMIRNEIYARHGYVFNTEPFKSYFESRAWYIPNENFNDSMFSEIEKTNKDFLVEYEISRGWR